MKHLLNDTRFNKQDRKMLSEYNKHRLSGSTILVQYRLANGAEELQLGRLFPNNGIGLMSFRFDLRNPLLEKHYWDTDIENCHYNIAERWCDKYDIPCSKLTYYIDNREDCLRLVSKNRRKAKTEFLKILYGGDIKLYSEFYNEVDGEVFPEGIRLLQDIKAEVSSLMNKIWEGHSNLHKIKIGSDKTPLHKKHNYKASLMSLLFQTEERKMLMFYAYLLKVKYNRVLGVFIHDGGGVEKLDTGETEFPKYIMDECSHIITQKFKIRVRITQKPIQYDWSPLHPKLTEYDTRKMEFEKRNFFVGSQFVHIQEDGIIEFVKTPDMKIRMRCNNYSVYNPDTEKTDKKYFFEEWLDDADRKKYDRIDFIPDKSACPDNVFNLFKGFNAEKFEPTTPLSKLDILMLVKPILKQMDFLTSGYSFWLCRWFASKLQRPLVKNEVGILLRDTGSLLTEGGGTGKNLLMEWIGNEIIGEECFYVVGDNRELYEKFNSQFEGKLLVMVEEASSKENHSNHDILKSKITAKKQNVNKKGVANYQVLDLADYLFCSNNRNPLPVKQGNRRLGVFDTDPEMRGNERYFNFLASHLNKPIVKWAFYQYLKSFVIYNSPVEFQNSIPITPAYIEIRILNAPTYLKWIVYNVKAGTLKDMSVRSLYESFRDWIKENKEGKEDGIMTETAFGILLNKSKDAGSNEPEPCSLLMSAVLHNQGEKRRTKTSMNYKWNIDGVVYGLKKLLLLEPDFVYEKAEKIEEEADTDNETDC